MGRGSIQIGRGSNKGEEELYIGWAGAYYAQRSLIQPISRHPEFHVTDSLLNSVMLTISAIKMADFSTALSTGFGQKILGTILKFMHCRNISKLSFI